MQLENILSFFALDGAPISCEPYGNGHINRTYLVVADRGHQYILQKINDTIFPDVDGLMGNVQKVTEHLRRKGLDSRHVLTIIPAKNGAAYVQADGGYWRIYDFITDSVCMERPETAEDFRQSAVAFGQFQNQLADFPAGTLVETIARFHDTPDRFEKFKKAVESDEFGRAKDVRAQIDFVMARERDAAFMMDLLKKGELPLRVTHNDTKLNNVMLDARTREPLCVIDLDTVMPGLSGNDFGDSIRFGASTGAEDEKDLEKVWLSLDLFRAYADGFLSACGEALTPTEIETLPMAARLMTFECGMRFLTDYLSGDTYFKIHYPEHNLVRCKTQFKLVSDMEKKHDDMMKIIAGSAKQV